MAGIHLYDYQLDAVRRMKNGCILPVSYTHLDVYKRQGYYSVFDAKALGSSSNAFALEAFKDNPLVAIQHLSLIHIFIITEKGNTLCYDVISGRYFKSDIEKLKRAEIGRAHV